MYFLYNHKKKKEKLYVEYERKHDSTNLIVQSNPGLIQKKRELANLGFEMLSWRKKLKFFKLYLEFENFYFINSCSFPGVSQEKKNIIFFFCGISKRKSGPQFGFCFQTEKILWRQKVLVDEKIFIYFLMWQMELTCTGKSS